MTTEAECTKSEEKPDDEVSSSDEEDKENSIHHPDNVDKPSLAALNNNNSPPVGAKLVLEKSLSISLFPDAPTTPKVCRKMIYDDEDEFKEIVKKYQVSESPQQKLPPSSCCDDEASNDCLLCHKKISPSKTSSLELDFDKGIIC